MNKPDGSYTTQWDIVAALEVLVRLEGSQKALAKTLGVSTQYLNDVLNFRRAPGAKICAPLGVRPVISFVAIDKPEDAV